MDSLSGNGWTECPQVPADPLKSPSPGPGSGGTPWRLFCFLFHFLQHLKTSPVIYVLPGTCVNMINIYFWFCVMINVIVPAAVITYTEILFLANVFSACSADGNKMVLQCSLKSVPQDYFGFANPKCGGPL